MQLNQSNEDIRARIEKEIEKTQQAIKAYKEESKPIAPENAIGRVSRMDAINNKSITEAALRKAEEKLNNLEIMLSRVDKEDFGKCAKCHQPIPLQRLIIMPQSNYCVKCAR